ncbi:hypothetical protein D3C72_2594250 [compost metagenome]
MNCFIYAGKFVQSKLNLSPFIQLKLNLNLAESGVRQNALQATPAVACRQIQLHET